MDYSKTKIYKIYSHIGDKIYVGSTTKDYLSQRMTAHRKRYSEWKRDKYHFVTSFILFDEYGVSNCKIELLEAGECENKDEKNKMEGKFIRSLECVNKLMPDPNKKERQKEYNEKNKEKIKDRQKEYREKNKDIIRAQRKEFRENNKDAMRSKRKEYYEKNKEKIKEHQKEYGEKNKDVIGAKKKEYKARKKAEQSLI